MNAIDNSTNSEFINPFSNPSRAFRQLIYIGVYRGKHVTQILPIDWS